MSKFIEVYLIPTKDFADINIDHKRTSNLRLINVSDISRVQVGVNNSFKDRAEIILQSDSRRYDVLGTYEEILERIGTDDTIVRISK